VIRAGFGLYYDDSRKTVGHRVGSGEPEFRRAAIAHRSQIQNALRHPHHRGVQHAFNERWTASADYIHEQGNHGYRAFPYPAAPFSHPTTAPVSTADAAPAGHMRRFNLVANYTLSKAQPGLRARRTLRLCGRVCTAQSGPNKGKLDAFGPGDYGPPAKMFASLCARRYGAHPGGFELSTITQVESARPSPSRPRTTAGAFRFFGPRPTRIPASTSSVAALHPVDLRVTRPININERWRVEPSSNSSISLTAITLERIMRSNHPDSGDL